MTTVLFALRVEGKIENRLNGNDNCSLTLVPLRSINDASWSFELPVSRKLFDVVKLGDLLDVTKKP